MGQRIEAVIVGGPQDGRVLALSELLPVLRWPEPVRLRFADLDPDDPAPMAYRVRYLDLVRAGDGMPTRDDVGRYRYAW